MSSAFVKESEEEWLHDLSPTMNALINYLTRENNGVRVYEKNTRADANMGKTIYRMSNGMDYSIDDNNRWYMI